MKRNIFYTILFSLLMVFLFLSMIQKEYNIFNVKELKGVSLKAERPVLSLSDFSTGKYQGGLEKYISENFGFREPIIRLYNQYAWTCFKKTFNKSLVKGEDNWFYYGASYRDYFGYEQKKWHKSTEDAIKKHEDNIERFTLLRDVLKQFDIEFMTFMAPSKAFVYPEFLPEAETDTTSLQAFRYYDQRFTEIGFPNIEMSKWYKAMRDTLEYPLFPTIDSHWGFSSVYAFDSLFKYMNSLNDYNMPTISYSEPIQNKKVVTADEGLLNLMFPIVNKNHSYSIKVKVNEDENSRKPRVLFVGDSFIWSLFVRLPAKKIFEDVEVWYYNSTVHQDFRTKKVDKKEINTLANILKSDYVIFYSSGHQWQRGTFKFLEQTLADFGIKDDTKEFTMNEDVEKALIYIDIEKDKEWMEILKAYSDSHDMKINDVINLEADNVYHNKPLIKTNL